LPVFRYSAAPSTIDVRASSSKLGEYHEPHRRPPQKQFVALVVVCGAKSSARIPSRAERGLSQEALGHECGINRTYLSSVERSERNVSIDNIARIAEALGVEPWTLFKDG
jgi:DNA-binding XRE family transcriptional regulator